MYIVMYASEVATYLKRRAPSNLGSLNYGVNFGVSLIAFLFISQLCIHLLRIHHLLHAHTLLPLIILPQLINIHRKRQSLNLSSR